MIDYLKEQEGVDHRKFICFIMGLFIILLVVTIIFAGKSFLVGNIGGKEAPPVPSLQEQLDRENNLVTSLVNKEEKSSEATVFTGEEAEKILMTFPPELRKKMLEENTSNTNTSIKQYSI